MAELSGSKDIDFYGFDTYDEMIEDMNVTYVKDCYEFLYKGEFFQILRDEGGAGKDRRRTVVCWMSEYIDNTNLDRVYEKDIQEYEGYDVRAAFENYILFDGVKLYDALMNGDIEFV